MLYRHRRQAHFLTLSTYDRENIDNLIEEEQFLESYDNDDQNGLNNDMDLDDPTATTQRQNDYDSTDYAHGGNIVASGDVDAAQAAREMNSVRGIKSKRIPNEKRTTTPYMTKYERARVLGTRALQIRYVLL